LQLDKLWGRVIPEYDVELKDTSIVKSSLKYMHILIQIFIGKHKSLWFIVGLLKRKSSIEK
jgi:hypothetical protein